MNLMVTVNGKAVVLQWTESRSAGVNLLLPGDTLYAGDTVSVTWSNWRDRDCG